LPNLRHGVDSRNLRDDGELGFAFAVAIGAPGVARIARPASSSQNLRASRRHESLGLRLYRISNWLIWSY
jgi:hypothetical protein